MIRGGLDPVDSAAFVRLDRLDGEGRPARFHIASDSVMWDLARRVAEQAGVLRTAGTRSWTLQVEPEALGAVRIELSLRDHGVSAHLTASHPFVKELIEHRQAELRQALADHGLRMDRFSVNVGDPEQRSSGRFREGGRDPGPRVGSVESRGAARSGTAAAPTRWWSDGTAWSAVNVYV